MATKKQLMSSSKGQKQKVYRRGRVQRSAAGTYGDRRVGQADIDKGQPSEIATFLDQVMKTVPGAVDAWNKQENIDNEKKVNEGIASFKNANPDQRKKYRDAIRNGDIDIDESPYYREGLAIAQAESLSDSYGNSLFTAYENWEGKNDSDPEAFNTFIDEFDATWKKDTDALHDGVKKDHFWPKQNALISQLSSQHGQRQAKHYRDSSLLKVSEGHGTHLNRENDPEGQLSLSNFQNVLGNEEWMANHTNQIIENIERDHHSPLIVRNNDEKKQIQKHFGYQWASNIKATSNTSPIEELKTSMNVEEDSVDALEIETVYADLEIEETNIKKEEKPKPNVDHGFKKYKKEKKNKIADSAANEDTFKTGDPNRESVGMTTVKLEKAEELIQNVLDSDFYADNKAKFEVYSTEIKGMGHQVRIQFKEGIEPSEQTTLMDKMADIIGAGYSAETAKKLKKNANQYVRAPIKPKKT